MFSSIISTSIDLQGFLICIFTSLVLGIVVAVMHMKTTRYSKNFVTTLAVLPTLVTLVILLVNGNLGTAVAVAGSFSLVRFRSLPGNSKEIMNVFFAMAIGLAVGTGYIMFAIIATAVVSLFTLILYAIKFGEDKYNNKALKVVIPEDLDYTNVFDDILAEYTSNSELEQVKTINMGSMFELTYLVSLKKDVNEKEFIDKIRCRNGNLKVSLTHSINDQEL